MKAVVMAGGEGSRLRPLTIGRPKPMVPIVDAPVMEHIFYLLKRHGITEVVVTLQYLAQVIQEYFDDGSEWGMKIHYTVEDTPLGTAGSVKNAEHLLDEPFLVISGDALTDFDLSQVVRYHQDKGSMATLTLFRVTSPLEYGVVILDREGRVVRFLEKPSWGEVFSDTVNTGIYVLDPAIFRYVPAGVPVDWSNDVFPQLLRNGDPMFGYVAGGYWCDVGNIGEYVRANADLLNRVVDIDVPGVEISAHTSGRVWVASGGDASVDPTARLYGPVFLGKGVDVRAGAVVHGPSVIGDYTVVEERATIDRSVIWPNCYLGEHTDLHGALVGKQCSVKAGTVVFEGAVIGDNCTIGEGAIIRPNVKLWPNKEVEAGATVSASIIWSTSARRGIFSQAGVSGLANVEMVPEFAARLGAAYGSMFPKGTMVTTNRDLSRPARMIKRALMAGLVSAGVDLHDIGEVPVPVLRYETRLSEARGGLHVRVSPDDRRQIDVKILDGAGLNIDKNTERKIESTFFREDYRRVPQGEVGEIVTNIREAVLERYTTAFLAHVDRQPVVSGKLRVAVDYGLGSTSAILPSLLGELGAEAITINAATRAAWSLRTPTAYDHDLRQLAAICRATQVHAGVMMDNDGKTIALVDDQGEVVPEMTALAALATLAWRVHPGSTVAVPATAPHIMESLAAELGGRVQRVPASAHAQMRAAETALAAARDGNGAGVPVLVGDGLGSYIFPDFHPGFDGMMAVARLLQYLGAAGQRFSDLVAGVPSYYVASTEAPCPWDAKGRVMRGLHERASQEGAAASVDGNGAAPEQVEGVRFDVAAGGIEWALVLPDSDRPVFHVYTEGTTQERADALAGRYAELVKTLQGEGVPEPAGTAAAEDAARRLARI